MAIAIKKHAKVDITFLLLPSFTGFLYFVPNILSQIVVPLQTSSRSSHRRCSVKVVFLKICEISQENISVGVSSKWSCRPTLLKSHMCFLVKFRKFLRTPILKNIWERLLLSFLEFTKLNHNVFLWLSWRHCFLYNNIINC